MSSAAMPRRRARPFSRKSLISHLTAKVGQTEALARRHRPARPRLGSLLLCMESGGFMAITALAMHRTIDAARAAFEQFSRRN